jgi:putative transposase
MDAIKGDFARQYNILRRKVGERVWQIRYYDRGIRSEIELVQKINYIHNNPVKSGFVEKPLDWVFSSAKWYEQNTRKINFIDLFQ